MTICLTHKTEYTFSQPVFLEPHTLRLSPRCDQFQQAVELVYSVAPEPIGFCDSVDLDGTTSRLVWFSDETDFLSVETSCTVAVTRRDPFSFLLYPGSSLTLPFTYSDRVLSNLVRELTPITHSEEIRTFTLSMITEAGGQTLPFLSTLTKYFYEEWRYERRQTGSPYSPEKTFNHKKGSCRDITLLFMAICREAGIAARYVSGYFFDDDNDIESELHAWVDVYLPGAGWRGIDPTNGVMVAENHIVLASSPDPFLTLPVQGTYRGLATSIMEVDLLVKKR